MRSYRVGIVGATGMVGQRFISLLQGHPWFHITALAASARSAGKPYREAVGDRWAFDWEIPAEVADMTVLDAQNVEEVAKRVDFIFCAVDMKKDEIRALEENYARHEVPVVSATTAPAAACRTCPWWFRKSTPSTSPSLKPSASGWARAVRIYRRQSPTAPSRAMSLRCTPLLDFVPEKGKLVCTYQAISGAGKTFKTWPEMVDNVIPYIGGEDEKSEQEPLKLWGSLVDTADGPVIENATAAGHQRAVPAGSHRRRSHGRSLRELRATSPAGRKSSSAGTTLRPKRRRLQLAQRAQALPAVLRGPLPSPNAAGPGFSGTAWAFPSAACGKTAFLTISLCA